jgi:hypothetical protein
LPPAPSGVEGACRLAKGGFAMRVIEHEREHYEVHEVAYGKVYSWRPERLVFECDCGESLDWTGPVTVCGCGAVHTDVPQEPGVPWTDEKRYRPWLEEYEQWRREKDANNLRHEYFTFVEAGGAD